MFGCGVQAVFTGTAYSYDEVKKALGVNPSINFESCNMQVNQAFAFQGDGARNRAKLLPELVEDGIRVLIYAGDADMACNYVGNERWVEELETKFQPEFKKNAKQPWVTLDKGELSGWVRSAGGDGATSGNITYVQVHAAGYVPSLLNYRSRIDQGDSIRLATWCRSTSPRRSSGASR